MNDLRRLLRWTRLARPPGGALFRALLSGIVASVTSTGLLVGAVALLVASARRPGLSAVAGALIVIELFAFLRSPLRFSERLSAHRLGFLAVTRWRRWLIASVGRWDYSRWRRHASGDLLERALRDTDELQDLWLRFSLPIINTAVTLLIGDVVIALLPSNGHWSIFAALLLLLQIIGVLWYLSRVPSHVALDQRLRSARSNYQSQIVELSAVAPELALLDRNEFSSSRLQGSQHVLEACERAASRVSIVSGAIPAVIALAAVGALWWTHPMSSPTWTVVAGLLALSTSESMLQVRAATETAVAVSAAARRLEELETAEFQGTQTWPTDDTIRIDDVCILEGDVFLLKHTSLTIPSGRKVALVGDSGSGKSTLLRAIGGLEPVASGEVFIGPIEVSAFDEPTLRRNLAYVASEPGLTRGFARDVVTMGRVSERRFEDDLVALGVIVGDRWGELSRGERQRVAIVRSLVSNPRILILDEPTSGLGNDETNDVLNLLSTLSATVLIATHDPLVMKWCDDVFELRDGDLRLLSR